MLKSTAPKILMCICLFLGADLFVFSYVFPGFGYLPPADSSTPIITRTGCPRTWPSSSSLCCWSGSYMYSATNMNQAFVNKILSLFPDNIGTLTAEERALRNAYLSSTVDPNFYFTNTGFLEVTLILVGAGFRNQFGIFLFDGNNNIIPNSMMEVFPDTSFASRTYKTYSSLCHVYGDTVRLGPFPDGTRLGFYINSNGAGYGLPSSDCERNRMAIESCLASFDFSNPNFYYCYTLHRCNFDPNIEASVIPHQYFYTLKRYNTDNYNHVAIIQDANRGEIYLGFEDLYNGGDNDYNDLVIMIKSTVQQPQLPTLCFPNCVALNGKCDFAVGRCVCNSRNPRVPYNVTDCSCNCGCQNGGICVCETGTCSCPSGFSGPKCECINDSGNCYGNDAIWSCNTCKCNNGRVTAVRGFNVAGTSLYHGFGASSNAFSGFDAVDVGSTINVATTTFRTYGWNNDMRRMVRPGPIPYIEMTSSSIWTIFALPGTTYDVRVVVGGAFGISRNTLSIIVGNNQPIILASRLEVAANSLRTIPVRITTGSSTGRIQFTQNGDTLAATALHAILIDRPPCTCLSCAANKNCSGNGFCNCDTGSCSCLSGWEGVDCACRTGASRCINGLWNCQTGVCNCNPGWEGPFCTLKKCPDGCIANGGTCDSSTGVCQCPLSRSGPNCSCKFPQNRLCSNYGVANCTTGVCDCPRQWSGPSCECSSCSSLNYCSGNKGVCNCDGTCRCNADWNGNPSCSCRSPQVTCKRGTLNCQTGLCDCPPGYSGADCGCISDCPKYRNCSGKGTCNCDGTCTCNSGWKGNLECSCATPVGVCVRGTLNCETGKCNCPAPYFGDLCQMINCNGGNGCRNGGICNTTTGTCICPGNYIGADCSCLGCRDKCDAQGSVSTSSCTCDGKCMCKPGYYGSDCSKKNCTLPCLNGGTCLDNGTCVCPAPYFGVDCGQKKCVPECSSTGSLGCNTLTGTCTCKYGFFGPQCSFQNCSSDCLNGGSCDLNSGTCKCPSPYFGNDCGKKPCNPVCLQNNTIFCDTNFGVCVCKTGYYGNQCQNKNCSAPCLNGGTCNTNSGLCECPNSRGDSCEIIDCKVNCEQGNCDVSTGKCVCRDNFSKLGDYLPCNCSTLGCPTAVYGSSCSGKGICSCGSCKCHTGWSGIDCSCSLSACNNDCNGNGICNCGACQCNSLFTGTDCSIPACPQNEFRQKCNGHGTCNYETGHCTCDENWLGENCDNYCVRDACGVCNGDSRSCIGCDYIPNSNMKTDACGVCGGNNSTCSGCDGVPYSGVLVDQCGICGGNGSTCIVDQLCQTRQSCSSCNQRSSITGNQACAWCNSTQSCRDNKIISTVCDLIQACPVIKELAPFVPENLTTNEPSNITNAIIGGVAGALIIGGAIAVSLLESQRRRNMDVLDPLARAKITSTNPIYNERTLNFNNPLYEVDSLDAKGQ